MRLAAKDERSQLLEGSELVSSLSRARKALGLGASLVGVALVIGAVRGNRHQSVTASTVAEAAEHVSVVDTRHGQGAVEVKGEGDRGAEYGTDDDDDYPSRIDARGDDTDRNRRKHERTRVQRDTKQNATDSDVSSPPPSPTPSATPAADDAPLTTSPHIMYILADDLGWNDIGYQSTDLSGFSPHLDDLASRGVKLSNFYGMHQCTPARSALLTGMYPIHTGMYHGTILAEQPWALPLKYKVLPEWLHDAGGYNTQMIGKWDVGHYAKAYVPTQRGFDGFFGYYSAYASYFSHVAITDYCMLMEADPTSPYCWVDMHDGNENHYADGEYSTKIFGARAVTVVEQHAATYGCKECEDGGGAAMSKPLFLYYAPTAIHAPTSVPDDFYNAHEDGLLKSVPNIGRKLVAAELLYLDNTVRNITSALERTSMFEDTVIIFSSDNGPVPTATMGGGSAYPFRGRKLFLWEGGVHLPAFVYAPKLLPKAVHGTTYKGLAHLTDILPTLIAGVLDRADLLGYGEDDDDVAADDVPKIAGGDDADDADREAVIDHDPSQQSQQQQHQTGAGRRRRASSATGSAATLDGVDLWAALRGESPEYPRQELLLNIDNFNDTIGADGALYHAAIRVGKWKLIHELNQTWWGVPKSDEPDQDKQGYSMLVDDLDLNMMLDPAHAMPVHALYNLDDDPSERHNVSGDHPDIVHSLHAKLERYAATQVATNWCADASHRTIAWDVFQKHDGFVVPWLDDVDYMYRCTAGGTGVDADADDGAAGGGSPFTAPQQDDGRLSGSTGGGAAIAPAVQNRWHWV